VGRKEKLACNKWELIEIDEEQRGRENVKYQASTAVGPITQRERKWDGSHQNHSKGGTHGGKTRSDGATRKIITQRDNGRLLVNPTSTTHPLLQYRGLALRPLVTLTRASLLRPETSSRCSTVMKAGKGDCFPITRLPLRGRRAAKQLNALSCFILLKESEHGRYGRHGGR
jgi:hypothetical protein